MSDLYESDILDWSEHQAALLRRIAAGERSNDKSPDWPNIIEEIESVGRSQLSAVRSLLVQALLHDLKATAWPVSREVPHWRAEARGLRGDAADALTPSMRQRIDDGGAVSASAGSPARQHGRGASAACSIQLPADLGRTPGHQDRIRRPNVVLIGF